MCQNHHHQHGDKPHVHARADKDAHAATPDLAECPVMPGSLAVKADAEAAGLVRDYHGTRYWLCCQACAPLFDADPARYAGAR